MMEDGPQNSKYHTTKLKLNIYQREVICQLSALINRDKCIQS